MKQVDVNLNSQFNIKMNTLSKKCTLKEGFVNFIDSEYFFISLILIMGVFWFFQLQITAIIFAVLYVSIIIWLKNDFKPILMVLASLCYITRVTYGMACVLLLFSSFAYILRNKLKLKFDKKMVLSLIGLSVAVLFAGFLYRGKVDSYVEAVAFPAYILLCLLFVFLYTCLDKDSIYYVLKILYYIGIFVAFQLFIYYFRFFDNFKLIFDKKLIYMGDSFKDSSTGWGISNHVGCVFLYTIPATLYMATKSKHGGLFYIPTIIMYVALILTGSRGSLLFMTVAMIPMVVFSILYAKNERMNFVYALFIIILIAIGVYIFRSYISNFLLSMLDKGMSTSGRIDIYIDCILAFSQNVIFGVGNSYKAFGYAHSTLFQWIANSGLVGLAALVYHMFVKYQPLFKKPSKSNIFAFFALILPECYGMIDCNFFMANFMFLSAILITSIYFNQESNLSDIKYLKSNFGLIKLD